MTIHTAQWWINECGGVYCSHCGEFHDDYCIPAPDTCPCCGSLMTPNEKHMIVDNKYRLSSCDSIYYLDEAEYPGWLLALRHEYLSRQNGGITK